MRIILNPKAGTEKTKVEGKQFAASVLKGFFRITNEQDPTDT